MSEITNEIAVSASTLSGELGSLSTNTAVGFYSSMKGDDFESKLEVLAHMTDSEKIEDHLNKTLQVTHIIVQAIEMLDEESGELKPQPRITLIDADGKAYSGISAPLYRDVKGWINALGEPATWKKPLPVNISKEGKGNRRYFKALVIRTPKK